MASRTSLTIAPRIDQTIALLVVLNVGWVTWHLGGFLAGPLALAFPLMVITVSLVALRWWVLEPTGGPRGWWWPLPMLAWVGFHMAGLAEVPGRAALHGLLMAWGAGAFWIGLHLARNPIAHRILGWGGGVVVLGAVGAAIYQRLIDPHWLPMGREQSIYYLSRSGGPFGNPNNFAAWLGVILPVALAAGYGGGDLTARGTRSRWWARLIAGAALLGIGLTLSRGVMLSLVVTALVWLLMWKHISWGRRLCLMVGFGALLGAVGVIGYVTSPPIKQRVDSFREFKGERTRPHMWHIAVRLWEDRRWVGNGGGSYGALLEKHRPEGLWETPEYAHNDYLNTLSDYGVVGGMLSFGGLLVGVVWLKWRSRDRLDATVKPRAWVSGTGWGLVGLGLAVMVDFHLQSPAVLLLAGLGGGGGGGQHGECLVARPRRSTRFGPKSRWAIYGVLLMVAWGGTGKFIVPMQQAEALRNEARNRIDALEGLEEAREVQRVAQRAAKQLQQACALDPHNERSWADLAYAVSLQGYKNPEGAMKFGQIAEQAARRALAGSDEVAEYWVRLGVALDLQGRWGEAGLAFGRAVRLAPRQPVVWYYQGFHLSLKPMMHEMAKAALATCLRLDPWYDEAKLLSAALEQSP